MFPQQKPQCLRLQRPECLIRLIQRMVGQSFDHVLRRILLKSLVQQRQQRQQRQTRPVGAGRPRFRRRKQHHMQHHIVIGGIRRMAMRGPIRRAQMHLDIAQNLPPADAQTRPHEIGAAQPVPTPRMQDLNRPSVERASVFAREIPPIPDFLQQHFGKRKRPVKSLHLGHGGRLPD